ncbi:unnamed protein product [Owenia fusiformis]|uniref:Annelid erythrocruorin linker subunit C-terminal domain-containing protein n=1 Tax=Owenia fusiformis TaxID=6347 RepID=A0A8S4P2E6_OWEFU|nr:unnamed protein product [Owenia fusiformis]
MKLFILLVSVAVAAADGSCNCQFSFPGYGGAGGRGAVVATRVDAQELRIGRLEASIQKLSDKFSSSGKDYNEAISVLDYLNDKVEEIRPKKCADGQIECLDNGDCVNELLICDGQNDCVDGSDEEDRVCKLPFGVGKEYNGRLLSGNECLKGGYPADVSVTITSLTRMPWFPQRPKVDARVVYKYSDHGTDVAGSYKVHGYYSAATATLDLNSIDDEEDCGLKAKVLWPSLSKGIDITDQSFNPRREEHHLFKYYQKWTFSNVTFTK